MMCARMMSINDGQGASRHFLFQKYLYLYFDAAAGFLAPGAYGNEDFDNGLKFDDDKEKRQMTYEESGKTW